MNLRRRKFVSNTKSAQVSTWPPIHGAPDCFHYQMLVVGFPVPIAYVVRYYHGKDLLSTENHPVTDHKFPQRTKLHAQDRASARCAQWNQDYEKDLNK
ncbi:hypothetical protein [Paralysiella testudinis]|uniref:Uncharacterized protein n=1 Tax=Paralysiella testudinis TaxID=2809020 RepID=A0A892ZK91_9NEIS|nr:hypothetical protein [Paralysiella testudinis]QRQ83043.1 hypothetical protein JQU52_06695 [Paralysiella testudinis]